MLYNVDKSFVKHMTGFPNNGVSVLYHLIPSLLSTFTLFVQFLYILSV